MTVDGRLRMASPTTLRHLAGSIFEAEGFSPEAADIVAESLVGADCAGVPSHGVMLLPMYIERIRRGSVSRAERGEVVADHGAVAVLDGKNALGQLTGRQAMGLAVERAVRFGLGAVGVRHAFHFGRAAGYACQAAEAGCIGFAMSNTRPLMPGVGGAEPVVGNNPLAVAVPRTDEGQVVLDMAMSEAALGKIRIAEAEGREIPSTWATDRDGFPTTDPAAALKGLLLPTGGAKGFGLALVIDVLTGVLTGGAYGKHVAGLYADTAVPNDCAHFFLALNVDAFGGADGFLERMEDLSAQVHAAQPRAGVDRVLLPGEPEAQKHHRADIEGISLDDSVIDGLIATAQRVGVDIDLDLLASGVSR